jgi:hypothetical protein
MGIGTSLFLIAVGAILRWAVADSVDGVDLQTIGLILLIVGVIGLIITFLYENMWRNRAGVADRGAVVERERVTRDPYA